MRKFFLPFGAVFVFLFLGLKIFASQDQIVPVTVAQLNPASLGTPNTDLSSISGNPALPEIPSQPSVSFTQSPMVVEEQPLPATSTPTSIPAVFGPQSNSEASSHINTSRKGAKTVIGVSIPGKFSLPVLQQPDGNLSFVSPQDQTITQFSLADAYGTIGLLAHNNLSGKNFFELREGENVVIFYENGRQERFQITRIVRFQALSPTSTTSYFVDLADPANVKLSSTQVFQRIYTPGNRVVFQTCIEAYGIPSWGRIFVIAEKAGQ